MRRRRVSLSTTTWRGWLLILGLAAAAPAVALDCAGTRTTPDMGTVYAAGWGIDERNTRYQPASRLTAANAERLELAWTYGLASTSPRSWPLVTSDTIFVGDSGRGVVALARDTGCERWLHPHDGEISSAIVHGRIGTRDVLLFNDRRTGVHVIDASDGTLIWHAAIDVEPIPWYSGTPLIADGSVFVPISSMEVALAMNPLYGCCTTRGGMAAFDLASGRQRWYLSTIDAPARQTGSHWLFVQEYGPSGAAVWATPSYDAARGRIYFGTGQNYSHPTTDTSDSLFAVDARSGQVIWKRQYTANDAYTAACNIEALNHPNCARPTGPDVDFGSPTMLLRTTGGRELLVAGQKSAEVHALDPASGEPIWTSRVGRGGIIGGVHWGLAANEAMDLVFVPISDKGLIGFPSPGEPAPGLYALDLPTGAVRWHHQRESRCDTEACIYGLSAAITAANDVVVAGSMDGYLEVVTAATGKAVWTHDAWRDYDSVNGVPTSGGAFDAHGPLLADDLLVAISGYGYVGRQRGGNAVLVFRLAPQP